MEEDRVRFSEWACITEVSMKRLVGLVSIIAAMAFLVPATGSAYNDSPGGNGCNDPYGCLQYWYFWGGICAVNVFPDGHAELWSCSGD